MMSSNDFTTWLQGFFEISEANSLTEKQVRIIKDHLALVFIKITPDRNEISEKKESLTEYLERMQINPEEEKVCRLVEPPFQPLKSHNPYTQKYC